MLVECWMGPCSFERWTGPSWPRQLTQARDAVSRLLHFRSPEATGNAGTSMYRGERSTDLS
jgi:hypothetical protein